jgi:hypothetical protein
VTVHRHSERESDVEALIRAGDELRDMLSRAPGIDPMRSVVLEEWKVAKRRVTDPYGSHLREATR